MRIASSSNEHSSIAEFTGKVTLLRPHLAINSRSRFLRFGNKDEAKHLMILTSKLNVHIERNFYLMFFIPPLGEIPDYLTKRLYRWIQSRAWKDYLMVTNEY